MLFRKGLVQSTSKLENHHCADTSCVSEDTSLPLLHRVLELNCQLIDIPRNPLTHVAKCNKKLFEKDFWNFRS